MMLTSPFPRLLLLLFASWCSTSVYAQTPFFSEDFSGSGLPTSWSTRNLNGSSQALWTWCAEHSSSDDPPIGCPLIFDDIVNRQDPFGATTANNGFLVFDSDFYFFQGIADRHNSVITSPIINCLDKTQVWLKFESHIGVFNRETRENAVVEVSTDGVNWTGFEVVDLRPLSFGDPDPGITGWSLNPEVTVLDLSAVAATQEEVQIRWRWDGEAEFYWAIDDVALYESDPAPLFIPQHDLRLTNFYAVAPNQVTPLSQVDRFGFLADIKNDGLQDQTGVELLVTVRHQGDDVEVYRETKTVADIDRGELRQNILFDGAGYLPDRLGVYEITYTISADSTDGRPENNVVNYFFEVSDRTFAKEEGILSYTAPVGVWEEDANHSWGWGNYFYCPKGLGFVASSVQFSIGGPLSNLADEFIDFNLYQWRDNDDQDGNCQIEERLLLGTSRYRITGFEEPGVFYDAPFGDVDGIELDDDGEYIVMLEFNAPNDSDDLEIAYNNSTNYGGQFLRSDLLGPTRHGSFVWIGNPDSTTFLSFGFGASFVPCLRLNLDLNVGTQEGPSLLAGHQLQLSPNPAREHIRVGIQLEEPSDRIHLSLWNALGTQQQDWQFDRVAHQQLTVPISHLAAGVYWLRMDTERGYLTKRFVVE
ncbi:MAG: T9SS type A sorting domain-containing protein [Bacteroidota bacterium]